MSKEKISRRRWVEIAGGTIVGLAVGAAAGYLLAPREVITPAPTPTATPAPTPTATPAPTPTKKVLLGCLWPLTGPYAMFGKDMMEAGELAIHEWREKGFNLDYLVRDTEINPAASVRRTRELVEEKKIDYLVGCLSSAVQCAVNEYARERKVFWMVGAACEPDMRRKGVLGDYVYMPYAGVETLGAIAGEWCNKQGYDKAYCLALDYIYGYVTNGKFKEVYEGEIVGEDFVPPTITDWSAYLEKFRASGAEILINGVGGAALIALLKQGLEFKLKDYMDIYNMQQWLTMSKAAGKEANEGIYGNAPFYWGLDLPSTKAFVKKFVDHYGHVPDNFGAATYAGIMELFTAIEETGSYECEDLARFLDGREFDWNKGKQVWRPCDHQAIQYIYVVKGKKAEDVTGEDYWEVVDRIWNEPYMISCEEEGY